jgi:predicted RND superfamily exporter protein
MAIEMVVVLAYAAALAVGVALIILGDWIDEKGPLPPRQPRLEDLVHGVSDALKRAHERNARRGL